MADLSPVSDSFGLLPSPAARVFGSLASMELQWELDRYDAEGGPQW